MFARIFIPVSRSFRSFCLKGRCTQCFKTGVVFHGITVVLSYFYGAWWSWTTHKTTESEALSLSFSFLPLFASCDSSSRKMHLSTVFTPFLLHKPTRARMSKHGEGMNDSPGNSCKLPRDILPHGTDYSSCDFKKWRVRCLSSRKVSQNKDSGVKVAVWRETRRRTKKACERKRKDECHWTIVTIDRRNERSKNIKSHSNSLTKVRVK